MIALLIETFGANRTQMPPSIKLCPNKCTVGKPKIGSGNHGGIFICYDPLHTCYLQYDSINIYTPTIMIMWFRLQKVNEAFDLTFDVAEH